VSLFYLKPLNLASNICAYITYGSGVCKHTSSP